MDALLCLNDELMEYSSTRDITEVVEDVKHPVQKHNNFWENLDYEKITSTQSGQFKYHIISLSLSLCNKQYAQ